MTTFARPRTIAEALDLRQAHPEARPIAGGTDLLVELNFGRLELPSILDLSRVDGLADTDTDEDVLRIGAGATYTSMIHRLGRMLPSLAAASRTVGSPPIRNRGTIGGNLGSASPAGDCHPPLLACRAQIELASADGHRLVPADEFFTGPKRSVLGADELIVAVTVPVARGPQAFAKVGSRNAMVIAVCSLAVALDPIAGTVGTGIGSAGPVPFLATAAESFLEGHLADSGAWESRLPLPDTVVDQFGRLIADAARPIDDVRGTSDYRRHALAILGRRLLTWCWAEYQDGREKASA